DGSALPTFSLQSPTPGTGFTQLPPTSAGATQATGDDCTNNVFEGDITIPDGTVLKGGEDFQKIWKIRNTGNCTWDDGFSLVYIGGSSPDLDPVNFNFTKSSDFVSAGEAVNIAINLTTPCTPGLYEGHWRMRNDHGYYFCTILSVYVDV
ncbi:MAG: NBR1-Ig-like domain-containing protein, partial [Anaerolineales bacterium]|nr:NBR1-Ig-like domain-containing protein [Anaerolineales bacterium]